MVNTMYLKPEDSVQNAVKFLQDKTKNSPSWIKWFWYALAGIFGVFAVAYFIYSKYQAGGKLAEALHDRDVLLEKRDMAVVDATVASSDEKIKEHAAVVAAHEDAALKKEEQIKELKAKVENSHKTIESLKGWDDVNKRVKF